jgi:hypothetical protein
MPRTWSIDGVNWPARVMFTSGVIPAWSSKPHLAVRLEYEGLSASWPIGGIDGQAFARFFSEVARRREENLDGLSVGSLDADLTISAAQGWDKAWRQIDLTIKLSCDTQDPYWTTELRIGVAKDQLDRLAGEAREFFEAVGAV